VTTTRLAALLDGFAQARPRVRDDRVAAIGALLDGFADAREAWRRDQEGRANGFNLLSVLDITCDELRHSRVLAWLFERDLLRGTHAQGNLGLRLLLEELDLPREWADQRYRVGCEIAGDVSRIDLEIVASGHFLIHIENKIWSAEGEMQTQRQWADLQRRAAALRVPEAARVGLYLSPRGESASHPRFRSVAWGRVARVFERFAEVAKPPEVRLFAAHYARALRSAGIVTTSEELNDE
jgi:hypothetical protein